MINSIILFIVLKYYILLTQDKKFAEQIFANKTITMARSRSRMHYYALFRIRRPRTISAKINVQNRKRIIWHKMINSIILFIVLKYYILLTQDKKFAEQIFANKTITMARSRSRMHYYALFRIRRPRTISAKINVQNRKRIIWHKMINSIILFIVLKYYILLTQDKKFAEQIFVNKTIIMARSRSRMHYYALLRIRRPCTISAKINVQNRVRIIWHKMINSIILFIVLKHYIGIILIIYYYLETNTIQGS